MMKVIYTSVIVLFMVVLLSTTAFGDSEREREQERRHELRDGRRFEDLEPGRPKEYLKSEGGRIEEWRPEEFKALRDANIDAAKLTLNPRGLLLPAYMDSHALKIVIAGSAWMGLVLPIGDRGIERNVYRVRKGDVIAIPRGVPVWWYNDGNERTEIVAIAETTSSGEEPVQIFPLAGGKEGKLESVLKGFDREIVARAWDVDEQTVARILDSQKGAGIVKVSQGLEIPVEVADENGLFADFVYRLEEAEPDYRRERGGHLIVVNRYKLAVLEDLDLGVACLRLEPNAMAAPGYSTNAHQVMYVVKGSGRIQIVRNNGSKALDTEVREGSLIVVPRFFPFTTVAGRDGLSLLSVLTSDLPFFQYLAGRNSVLNGIPMKVVAEAFNIDENLERKLRERSLESEAIILPPPSGSEDEHRRRREDERRDRRAFQ